MVTLTLEDEVFDILAQVYPAPDYVVIHHPREKGLKWSVDFLVKKGDNVLFAMEVKEPKISSASSTLDTDMERAFAQLALRYLRHKEERGNFFLIVPNDIDIPSVYERIFGEIDCLITTKDGIPRLKESWH